MKISLIIATYKQIEDLRVIIHALKTQSYKNFEVIIAEDNNSQEMKDLVNSVENLNILHTYQEDIGIFKARSQNNAILAATGDYLVFIDADCVPHSQFLSGHATLALKGQVLAGRRVNLGPKYSLKLKQNILTPMELEKQFWLRLPNIMSDCKEGHIEAGLSLNPNGFLFKTFVYPKSPSIVGCHFSCFKEDIVAINGFDESYGESNLPDDTDIEWRFRAYGMTIRSCKFAANLFHLYHSRSYRDHLLDELYETMIDRKEQGLYFASVGLDSH